MKAAAIGPLHVAAVFSLDCFNLPSDLFYFSLAVRSGSIFDKLDILFQVFRMRGECRKAHAFPFYGNHRGGIDN